MKDLEQLCRLIRYYVLLATTEAGSGHMTSSLSAVELMTALFFKHFRYDVDDPKNLLNDHLIFSKGHASPLFYALFAAAGKLKEEDLKSFRDFHSKLEGHPSLRFAHTEAPTGSLGQGLSIGVGIALDSKYLEKLPCKTFVLLGDGELAEGQIWEAAQIASHYKLNNLIAIADINRLGQSGETMLGHDIHSYAERFKSFGWAAYVLEDGHDLAGIDIVYKQILGDGSEKPAIVIAKTIKGKGVGLVENKEGWHGKVLSKAEFEEVIKDLGGVDTSPVGSVSKPGKQVRKSGLPKADLPEEIDLGEGYKKGEKVATRRAYGSSLAKLAKKYSNVVALDADVKNSTFAEVFAKEFPERFFEMFIAEQNMVSTALGFATKGKIPFVSTFGAFFSRAADQIRMARLANEHIVFAGSHVGVSIGQDGASQMGLEDIALFRSGLGTTVFYPSDAVAMEKLLKAAYGANGIVYIRTTRAETEVLYDSNEDFAIGGSKTLKYSKEDSVTLVAAGITLHEAIKAAEELEKKAIMVRVIDLYSIKPVDRDTLIKAARETRAIITIEDHYAEGGLGDAVLEALVEESSTPVYKLAVRKLPWSGRPEELLEYEEIDSTAIVAKVKEVLSEIIS